MNNILFFYFALNHLTKSLKVAFLPYIKMPTLYIRADNQAKNKEAKNNNIKLANICQVGGSNANLTGMTIGENNGIMLLHTAKSLLGDCKAEIDI